MLMFLTIIISWLGVTAGWLSSYPWIAYDATICVMLAGLCYFWAGSCNHSCQAAMGVCFCKLALIPRSGTRNPTCVQRHSQPSELCNFLSTDIFTGLHYLISWP